MAPHVSRKPDANFTQDADAMLAYVGRGQQATARSLVTSSVGKLRGLAFFHGCILSLAPPNLQFREIAIKDVCLINSSQSPSYPQEHIIFFFASRLNSLLSYFPEKSLEVNSCSRLTTPIKVLSFGVHIILMLCSAAGPCRTSQKMREC